MIQAGQYVTDGNCIWIIEDTRNGHMVGEPFFDYVLRPGCLKLNGATITNASQNYPRLITYLNNNPALLASNSTAYNNNIGLFLYDSTTDSLTLPNYIDRFIESGNSVSHINAGLPNITGSIRTNNLGSYWFACLESSGAFQSEDSRTLAVVSISQGSARTVKSTFNASRSSTIYGKSSTVQPNAITLIAQIKY